MLGMSLWVCSYPMYISVCIWCSHNCAPDGWLVLCVSLYICVSCAPGLVSVCTWVLCPCTYVSPFSVCVSGLPSMYILVLLTFLLSCRVSPSKIGKKEKKEERKKIHVRVSQTRPWTCSLKFALTPLIAYLIVFVFCQSFFLKFYLQEKSTGKA